MGINPSGDNPIIVPPDNVQSRWGAWEADLDHSGEVAGEVVRETWAIANSANERAGFLEGVRGFAHAYMGENINAQWSFSGNWRMMPFNRQYGDSLGATVRSDGRVQMDSTGLWLVFVKVHGRATSWPGGGAVTLRSRIYRPGGEAVYQEDQVRGTGFLEDGLLAQNNGNVTLQTVFPVVIDTPGSYVRVDTWSAAWRWWDGGTLLSSLTVLKQSDNVEDRGDQVVPDESESGAGQ